MKIPTICRYCGGVIRLVPAQKIYGASTDRLGLAGENIYLCQNCNARVGCHKGTNRPLGNVANEVLRLKRRETHQVFDQYWQGSGLSRNVLYQRPAGETGLPMVFLHGYGQSRMGWMTTPDGRPGWSDLFLRMGHSVYLIDEPRRGEAGATSVSGEISTKTLDQRWYTQFRIGRWENGKSVVNEGSQFPNDDASVDQFFRQMTPDTGMTDDMGGDFDNETVARAVAATIDEVYERTGKDSILITHSQGGGPGWTAAQYTDHIAAIVAIEPGGAPQLDSADFQAVLEKNIPVTMYFGDYIDNGDPAIMATMMWQGMRGMCYSFRDAYNAAGGSCTVIDLPQEGITGNDHFMFQDLNNDVIAEHVEAWIQANVSSDGSSEAASNPAPTGSEGGKTLVAYYSATGSTQAVAQIIADTTSGDLFEIVPSEAYTSADLDWRDGNSRVSREHDDPSLRNIALTADTVDNWEDYDTVFIGYPIWWGIAAWPTDTFVKANDFTGKTVIPFCTSASSGLGESGELLAELAGTGDWQTGQRFRSGASEADVTEWVSSLGLK